MKFDLEKALKDGKAITRDGREVTQLTRFDISSIMPVLGVLEGSVVSWRLSGKTLANDDSSFDLQNAPEKLSGFVNVYADNDVLFFKEKSDQYRDDLVARIDLSQINVGHGLEDE